MCLSWALKGSFSCARSSPSYLDHLGNTDLLSHMSTDYWQVSSDSATTFTFTFTDTTPSSSGEYGVALQLSSAGTSFQTLCDGQPGWAVIRGISLLCSFLRKCLQNIQAWATIVCSHSFKKNGVPRRAPHLVPSGDATGAGLQQKWKLLPCPGHTDH